MNQSHDGDRVQPDLGYPATVGACLRRAAQLFGDRDFIVRPDERLTFADAEAASRELAADLVAAGVGKGTRVAIFYTYGRDFVVAWLAALRIGALVMPLSTLARPAEIRAMLRLGDIHLLLADRAMLGRDITALIAEAVPELADQLRHGPLRIPDLPYLRSVWFSGGGNWQRPPGDANGVVSDELLAALEDQVMPADLAQVTYTSGSAALPKGVVHSHGALVRNSSPDATQFAMRSVGLDGDVRVVFCAFPFFWVGGSLTLGQALQAGWTVCCLERFEPVAALDLIEAERVDRVWAWPSLARAMRTDPSFAERDTTYLNRVLPAPVTADNGLGRHRGMSETMGNWFGAQAKVIDPATGHPVPDGAEGELCVRGFAVMQGYYKREREDCFDADGWLHTGDRVVRVGPDLMFVGRYSEMIKSRGANVSPRELEVVLESFPQVRHALVLGLPHDEDGEQVAAVLVPAPGADLDVAGILRRLRGLVSSFKVPTRVEVFPDDDAVPWLATGKPDKIALRARLIDV